jgi:polysaccharide chain length determinant protein (PEP-CTERM system associated)
MWSSSLSRDSKKKENEKNMQAQIDFILTELRNLWRYRWPALVAAFLAAIVGWIGLFFTPNTFEASARVYVDATSALKPLLLGLAVDPNVDAQLNFVRQNMLSRPALEKVARQTELDLRATSQKGREQMIDGLAKQIIIEGANSGDKTSGDKLYTISYRDHNRAMALAVVTKLLNTFVEGSMGAGREGSENAERFIKGQIHDVEEVLQEEEAALEEFKKKNGALVPGQAGDYFTRLENEKAALTKAKSDLSVAQLRRDALKAQLNGTVTFVPAAGSDKHGNTTSTIISGGDISSRLSAAETALANLKLNYTDKHPEVVAMSDTVDQLRAQQREEQAALKRGDPEAAAASGLTSNPVYQQIQLAYNQAQVEVAGLQGTLADIERKVADLEKTKTLAPEVEAEYSRLNRDYTVTHNQYTALTERLDRAKLSEQASESGTIKFEIIDPPIAKLDPVKPNRILFTLAIFAGALVVGVAVGWLQGQLKAVFESSKKLADETGLPVLGTVSPMGFLPDIQIKHTSGSLRFIAAFSLLLIALCLALFLAAKGISYSGWMR